MNLPLLLGVVFMAMIAGFAITLMGYYTPFILMSTIVAALGMGLLSTLKPESGHPMWIGYECLFGLGIGAGLMQTVLIAQTVLDIDDTPTGTAALIFFQTLGSANRLIANLKAVFPGLDPSSLLGNTGATNLQDVVPPEYLTQVLIAYNKALSSTFYVGAAMASLSVFGSLGIEWKSVKGQNDHVVAV